ncbi:MAG: N-acetyltransferase [Hyphomonadaceae bacterium]|nr:N-acetyltransferase [Hyphomonadaceae bacterium]
MAYRLVSEHPEHEAGIERVLDRAFGPGRFAKTSERVRERGAAPEPELSRVALNEADEVIGVCRLWRIRIGAAPLHFLGPLAVDPAHQGDRLGLALAKGAVDAARASGGAGIVLVGAEPFFRPLGFSQIPQGRVLMPGPVAAHRFLWLELIPGAFDHARGEITS